MGVRISFQMLHSANSQLKSQPGLSHTAMCLCTNVINTIQYGHIGQLPSKYIHASTYMYISMTELPWNHPPDHIVKFTNKGISSQTFVHVILRDLQISAQQYYVLLLKEIIGHDIMQTVVLFELYNNLKMIKLKHFHIITIIVKS